MAMSRAGTGDPCVNAEEFDAMKQNFRDVGDGLTDQQLLELADTCHDILRWRRDVRLRHAAAAASAGLCLEPRSYIEIAASGTPTWDEAFQIAMDGAPPLPAE